MLGFQKKETTACQCDHREQISSEIQLKTQTSHLIHRIYNRGILVYKFKIMNLSIKFLSLLIINIFLFSLASNAQSIEINNSIKDTAQLYKAINLLYADTTMNHEVDKPRFTAILKSSLYLKDTLTFFKVLRKLNYKYYNEKELFQEGVLFLKESQKILGSEESRFGDFNNMLGNHYSDLNFKIEALDYYFKSVDWYQKYEKQKTTIPLGNIADIYFYNKNFDKALEYNELALEYSLKLTDEKDKLYNIVFDYFRIGAVYHELKNPEKAAPYFEKSLAAAREFNKDDMMLLSILYAIKFYSQIGNNEKCRKLIIEGDKICQDSESYIQHMKTGFLIEKNKHFLRIERLDKAIVPEYIQSKSPMHQREVYLYSANYYTYKKDIDKTVKYYDKLIEEDQKTERANRATIYSNIEEKFLNKKLRKENQKLINDIEKGKKNTIIILFGFVLMLSLLVLQLFNNRRYKKVNNLLQRRKRDLEKSNNALTKSNEELERFMFIASHDLKTPLRNIVSFTSLLEKRLKASKDDLVHQYLSFIKKGGLMLNNLITDTLEYSKLSDHEYPLEEIDLNKLLEELEASMSGYIRSRNAKIIKPAHLPGIKAHYSSFVVLFQNLIENGIKYNKSDNPTIRIYFKKNESFYSIFIEDNGIGIAEEYQDKVFIMFSRLHNQSEYEGSGLGLSTCRKIVRQVNGEIILHSAIGKGSIFEIRVGLNFYD